MRSWVFRHRQRLEAIYGLPPSPPASLGRRGDAGTPFDHEPARGLRVHVLVPALRTRRGA